MSGKIFVISAACGAGKSTLVSYIVNELFPVYQIERVITYTTRKPRKSEQHGRDYFFLSTKQFEINIKKGFFLEWSNTYVAYYGSPKSIIEQSKQGRSFILILDRNGAQKIVKEADNVVLILITVPPVLLKERLLKRGSETVAEITMRLQQSATELEQERQESIYHYTIINDDLGAAQKRLAEIIVYELRKKESYKLQKTPKLV